MWLCSEERPGRKLWIKWATAREINGSENGVEAPNLSP